MKSTLKLILCAPMIFTMIGCNSEKSKYDKMIDFAEKYTAAWNSKDPEKMASFYAENGSLIINEGEPSTGRKQLAKTARSYMEAFPDMVLTMDSLEISGSAFNYHWTFSGTNKGPGGTGNKVKFSGFEQWIMNSDGLIDKSIGTYDAEDYNRQVSGNQE